MPYLPQRFTLVWTNLDPLRVFRNFKNIKFHYNHHEGGCQRVKGGWSGGISGVVPRRRWDNRRSPSLSTGCSTTMTSETKSDPTHVRGNRTAWVLRRPPAPATNLAVILPIRGDPAISYEAKKGWESKPGRVKAITGCR